MHGLEINLRQSNSPVLLRWRRKAIEFTCLTQVAQNVTCCMTWRSIKAIKLTQLTLMAQNPKHCMVWRSIKGNRTHPLTQVVQYAKRCTVWRSIEGNRTDVFYLCGAVRQSNSPDSGGAVCYGILCHPSLTGEFDCLRLICRLCSAWHLVLPKSNGQVRLPSIAPKSMKR